MRLFLIKISIYLLSGIAVATLYFFIAINTDKICFLSNSISYNAKLRFILNNRQRVEASGIFIIGSSMSLNNLDGEALQKEFKKPVSNLAAWGMKVIDFKDVDFIKGNNKLIVMNMEFPDFGNSSLTTYYGYPLNTACEFINIAGNLKTYRGQAAEAERYMNPAGKNDYTSLNFDGTGSVALGGPGFKIYKPRWEDKISTPPPVDLDKFVGYLSFLKNNRVFLFFSPERSVFVDAARKQYVKELEKKIKAAYSNVSFYNNYELVYSDSLFVDNCHFNAAGREVYTKTVMGQIRESLKP